METCRHENKYLMGTADGIVCRACGKLFKSFDEINRNVPAAEEKPADAKEEATAVKPKRSRKKA